MKNFRIIVVVFVTSLIAITGCKKDAVEQTDNLKQTGILGQWKLETRVTDGISSLIAECCDYIAFKTDAELNDLKGAFKATGAAYETIGVFEVNTSANTIQFDYNDTQKVYEFQIESDLITFTYVENNQTINEYWRKEK
ncbi:MAG: hypothetical protein KJ578_03860 [Bacteroidetes bacterium]|nr:hypothetical protein [Bacteroidota bacterium]MBU1579084.1 hypothetical protein [Bacteroidota bacterium]MBU2556896.1 hypothetical protein [Bacteroidota bacterium]